MTDNLEIRHILDEMRRGAEDAMDPVNRLMRETRGDGMTTLESAWLHKLCDVCGHSFRAGDAVRLCDDGAVRHNSVELPCFKDGSKAVAAACGGAEVAALYAGLERAWPPPADFPVTRLAEGHPLLTAPTAHFRRRRACAVCGHTFRLHDQVILCPCRPEAPDGCLAAVHRDPILGLHCWDDWFPYRKHCPATSRSLA